MASYHLHSQHSHDPHRGHQDFDQVLDEAISLIQAGESVETCLARFPNYASRLEPLLQVADGLNYTSRAPLPVDLDSWLSESTREIETLAVQQLARHTMRRPWFARTPLMRLAVVCVVVLMLFATTSVVNTAAAASLPGDSLYQWKLASEQVQITFTLDPQAREQLRVQLVQERSHELKQLLEQPDSPSEVIDEATSRLQDHVHAIISQGQSDGADHTLTDQLDQVLKDADKALDQVREQASPERQEAVDKATTAIATLQEEVAAVASEATPTTTTAAGGMVSSPTKAPSPVPTRNGQAVVQPSVLPVVPAAPTTYQSAPTTLPPSPTGDVVPTHTPSNTPEGILVQPPLATATTPAPSNTALPTNPLSSATPQLPSATPVAPTSSQTAQPILSPTSTASTVATPTLVQTSAAATATDAAPSLTATSAITLTLTPPRTATPTVTTTRTVTATRTVTRTPTEATTATSEPTEATTATSEPTETATPTDSPTPSTTTTPTESPEPTQTATPQPTATATNISISNDSETPTSTNEPASPTPETSSSTEAPAETPTSSGPHNADELSRDP